MSTVDNPTAFFAGSLYATTEEFARSGLSPWKRTKLYALARAGELPFVIHTPGSRRYLVNKIALFEALKFPAKYRPSEWPNPWTNLHIGENGAHHDRDRDH